MKTKVLELFAGSRSIGKTAEELGYLCFSVDVKPFEDIHLVKDIQFVTPSEIPFIPDIVWGSPPCTTYSLAAISHHREPDGTPKTEFAEKSDCLVKNTLYLIQFFSSYRRAHGMSELKYYLENPRATLQNRPFMQGIPRKTVWYCQYGDIAAKPTQIFSNNIYNPLFNPDGWKPRPECWNGNKNCHHESAPRGSKTGTQGKKGNYERSKIPPELCKEILLA